MDNTQIVQQRLNLEQRLRLTGYELDKSTQHLQQNNIPLDSHYESFIDRFRGIQHRITEFQAIEPMPTEDLQFACLLQITTLQYRISELSLSRAEFEKSKALFETAKKIGLEAQEIYNKSVTQGNNLSLLTDEQQAQQRKFRDEIYTNSFLPLSKEIDQKIRELSNPTDEYKVRIMLKAAVIECQSTVGALQQNFNSFANHVYFGIPCYVDQNNRPVQSGQALNAKISLDFMNLFRAVEQSLGRFEAISDMGDKYEKEIPEHLAALISLGDKLEKQASFAAIGIAQYFEGIYRGSELDNWITKFLDKQLARKVK